MTAPLAPRLTPLDERVLNVLSTEFSLRALRVAELVHGAPHWSCGACGRLAVCQPEHGRAWKNGQKIGCLACWRAADRRQPSPTMRPVLIVSAELEREVAEVLRGLERVGLARLAGGWWRRA